MPRRQEYIALAERVGTATGPDRQLDIAITTLIHQSREWRPYYIPHYTRLLDDALSLALEYHSYELRYSSARRRAMVWDWRRGESAFDHLSEADAATLPLALCSALLLARADAEGGS